MEDEGPDADGLGMSREEWVEAGLEEALFEQIDTDQCGQIDLLGLVEDEKVFNQVSEAFIDSDLANERSAGPGRHIALLLTNSCNCPDRTLIVTRT